MGTTHCPSDYYGERPRPEPPDYYGELLDMRDLRT